jgi:protein-L-isoaspartate(D-aspartate) O-methyltransferase
MNLAVLGPHHLAVQVTDLAAAEGFYHGVLGLPVLKRWPFEDGRAGERALWLSAGPDTFVALELCGVPARPSDFRDAEARLHLFALRIDPQDRLAWEARLREAGIEIVHRSRWTVYARDPDGNRIGLSHHPHDVMSFRLHGQGIRDERVLAAFDKVPREAFVPAESKLQAFEDKPLDIGYSQTISQPYIVALMTEALRLSPGQRVLEIGTGSGYQTAILASLGVKVFSVERIPELSRRAAEVLKPFEGIELLVGDGSRGLPGEEPFDAILVTAAPATVPPALLEQLAPGGRLVIPVGGDASNQELQLWTKDRATGALTRQVLAAVRFVPLIG